MIQPPDVKDIVMYNFNKLEDVLTDLIQAVNRSENKISKLEQDLADLKAEGSNELI